MVETWYLLGWLNRIRATTEEESGYDGNVRFYLGRAREVHKKNPTDDADMVCWCVGQNIFLVDDLNSIVDVQCF